jgi:hypothetical protein
MSTLLVPAVWFTVRMILQMPPDVPLSYSNAFLFGDALAVTIGVLGVAWLLQVR